MPPRTDPDDVRIVAVRDVGLRPVRRYDERPQTPLRLKNEPHSRFHAEHHLAGTAPKRFHSCRKREEKRLLIDDINACAHTHRHLLVGIELRIGVRLGVLLQHVHMMNGLGDLKHVDVASVHLDNISHPRRRKCA